MPLDTAGPLANRPDLIQAFMDGLNIRTQTWGGTPTQIPPVDFYPGWNSTTADNTAISQNQQWYIIDGTQYNPPIMYPPGGDLDIIEKRKRIIEELSGVVVGVVEKDKRQTDPQPVKELEIVDPFKERALEV